MGRSFDKVTQTLVRHPMSRDSYERFLYFYLKDHHWDPEHVTVRDMLKAMRHGQIPKWNTLERARRLVQEEYPHLRGETYTDRKKKAERWRENLE